MTHTRIRKVKVTYQSKFAVMADEIRDKKNKAG